jgi:hypothetical protein
MSILSQWERGQDVVPLATKRDDLVSGWTVFDHPRDYPDVFVARRWVARRGEVVPTHDMFTADSLAELRALLPAGLICVPRMPWDDTKIVEVWL